MEILCYGVIFRSNILTQKSSTWGCAKNDTQQGKLESFKGKYKVNQKLVKNKLALGIFLWW